VEHKRRIRKLGAVLFVTLEYNHSVPGLQERHSSRKARLLSAPARWRSQGSFNPATNGWSANVIPSAGFIHSMQSMPGAWLVRRPVPLLAVKVLSKWPSVSRAQPQRTTVLTQGETRNARGGAFKNSSSFGLGFPSLSARRVCNRLQGCGLAPEGASSATVRIDAIPWFSQQLMASCGGPASHGPISEAARAALTVCCTPGLRSTSPYLEPGESTPSLRHVAVQSLCQHIAVKTRTYMTVCYGKRAFRNAAQPLVTAVSFDSKVFRVSRIRARFDPLRC
jgi:hypothetical protein